MSTYCCRSYKIPGLFALALMLALQAAGQPYYFKHYQVENGLSNNSVECSVQDDDGFLWFGTINGLNRFDGYTFKTFRHTADSGSIGANFIRCLYNDHRGRIWVGTNKGVYIYDKTAERFHPIASVPLANCSQIIRDGQGAYWFIIDRQVYRYRPDSDRAQLYPLNGGSHIANSLVTTAGGELWLCTRDAGLRRYRAAVDSFETYSVYTGPHANLPLSFEKLYALDDTHFLIGTNREGAKYFDVGAKSYRDIFSADQKSVAVYAREFIERNPGEVWIGTETGIYILDRKTDSLAHLQKQYDNPYSISDNVVFTFCKDREGGLWVGTYLGGVNYLPRPILSFEKFFHQSQEPSLSGNGVHEICKDRFGHLWVGTEDAGVNRIDLKTGAMKSFQPDGSPHGLSYHNIHGLLASGNELWIGTFEHGLDVMDIPSGKVIRHYNAGGTRTLPSNFVVTIYETRAHQILVGTWRGLCAYNRATDDFTPVSGYGEYVQAMLEDRQGVLWVCTQGDGVYWSNAQTGRRGHFVNDPHDSASLVENHVNGVFQDSRGRVWFATEGGLCCFDKLTAKMRAYTTADGLPDNFIFRVMEDDRKNLWVSTSKGLVCFDPVTRHMTTYKQSNGLLSDQFNYNSSFQDTDGTMYFGSVKGMIRFNPGRYYRNTAMPPVYVTGFQVNNAELVANDPRSPLKTSITYSPSIRLPHDQSTISIDFAALSYAVPEMNEYAYKMEGFDRDWTYLKTNRKVYFTKLPPGNYVFKVRGSNSSGVWNEQETRLEIDILPPFWESPWAYIFYTFALLALLYLLFRYYARRTDDRNRRKIEKLEIEKEREIYHAKIEFFTNVAHEIRTPLTLIKMPLDKLVRQFGGQPEINENLRVMEKNTNRLVDLTNQLLDFRKTETDKFSLNFVKTDVSTLLREMFSSFQPAAEQRNLVYRIDMPRMSLQAFVDPEALKKILSNVIGNAVKYAEREVTVRLLPFGSDDNIFTVETRNDGFLIPYESREKIFEPFYRIRETAKQEGTGIGLALSRSLAESHKGLLELKRSEGAANIFSLTLPIHQDTEFVLRADEADAPPIVATGTPAQAEDPNRPVILLAEDNRDILDFVSRELTAAGYTVRQAANGSEALDVLRKNMVQLVISDIMMPVMDGLELCRAIRTDLDFSHVPIILLTAKNSLHAKIEGLETGADAYIEKPFAFEHLAAQISNLLANRVKIREYFASSPLAHIKTIGYSRADKAFLERLNELIQENITNKEVDVENFAKMMNMSRATFYRKIKVLSNLTPHELISIARLKKAAELLAEGDYRVFEVAAMVGYSLQTNFARDFHKQFGMTPSEYLQSRKAVEK